MSNTLIALLTVTALTGCSEAVPVPENLVVAFDRPISQVTPDLVQPQRADVVGVAIEPDTGDVLVLDAGEGIFRVGADGLEAVAGVADLMVDGRDRRPYTDLAALGNGRYLVTVQSDGLLHDAATGTTTAHFCYEPNSMPVVESSQLTHAITVDAEGGRIFAQPQTSRGNRLEGAQVGTYTITNGGQPESWFELGREEFQAHGMVHVDGRLLMAEGDTLWSYTFGDRNPRPFSDLAALELGAIEGLALAPDGALLAVGSDRLVEVTGWRP